MATPPPFFLPPIRSFDPLPTGHASFPPPSLPPQFDMPSESAADSEVEMDLSNSTTVAPPVAASAFHEELDGAADNQPIPPPEAPQDPPRDADAPAPEGSIHEDDEDEDDDESDGEDHSGYPWHPIEEDKSVPCDDEITYIQSKEERSALDHTYWEQQTFFDLRDPELAPGESGRIDWVVEHFNGTKEKPNKELIMRSPVVQIGGYEWQIKFYPKGNRTDFLSVYLECVTMLGSDFQERTDDLNAALPVLAGSPKMQKRNAVAAQLAVVMYNPAEPRVYEYKTDAYTFHKKTADFGWKYFNRDPRYDFHIRRHGQRQAILRDDKLAFTAYIRIVHDPTGCMWTSLHGSEANLAVTGLRPFDALSASTAALVPLLHLRPFRDLLYHHQSSSEAFTHLQVCLDKMLCRRLKRKHLKPTVWSHNKDVVDALTVLRDQISQQCAPEISRAFDDIFSSLSADQLPICHNRLRTKAHSSIQEALKGPRAAPVSTPQVLTMELERQEFNRDKRRWEKINNKVRLDSTIVYGGKRYLLYAFVTHSGPLGSSNYTPYVRPGGPGGKWYAYEANQVRCLTQKQALQDHCGSTTNELRKDSANGLFKSPESVSPEKDAAAYLVMYVRGDVSSYAFAQPAEEHWDIPETVRKSHKVPEEPANSQNGTSGHDQEKTAVPSENAVGPGEFIEEQPVQPPSRSPPPQIPRTLMEGDDVVMSDIEEDGGQTPIRHGSNSTNELTKSDRLTLGDDKLPSETHQHMITRNFFASEYYSGLAISPNSVYHGEGHLIASNGDEYRGNFDRGIFDGKGTMVYADSGNTYSGDWQDGKHHGQGTYTELATGNVFEGGWKEGKRHGSFVLRGTVTDEDKGRCQICYEKDMSTAFYDCGHVLACRECASQIENCPVCRKRVLARLELYGVKVSME